MGHLWQYQSNRLVLWTYWHCPVSMFLWRQQGRQSKHGRHRGKFGFQLMVILMDFWAVLGAAAKFNNAACVLVLSSSQGDVSGFAGKVGCQCVKTRVKTTAMCLSGERVADILANLLVTQHKKLLIGVPGRHDTSCHLLACRQYVSNMTKIWQSGLNLCLCYFC
jgi:hypothetical protein